MYIGGSAQVNITDTAIHGNQARTVRLSLNFLLTPSSEDCFDTALVGRNFQELTHVIVVWQAGGIWIVGSAQVSIVNTTIHGNQASYVRRSRNFLPRPSWEETSKN